MSKIIFLNGCSSTGKSHIVAAIQDLSEEPWLNLSVDIVFRLMPPKYLPFGEKAQEGIQFVPGKDKDKPTMEIKSGDYGKEVAASIPKVVKQLADDGHNLIIDEVIWERENLEKYSVLLKKHQAYLVNVTCELSRMEKREKIHGDRAWGLARAQYAKMKDLPWKDLEVDTSHREPYECAKIILEFVKNKEPKVFIEIWQSIATKDFS